MKAIDPGGKYGRPVTIAEDQDEYLTLVARIPQMQGPFGPVDQPVQPVVTRWQLSDEERQAIASGADVMLQLMTFGQPLQPIYIWIGGREAVIESEVEEGSSAGIALSGETACDD